MIIYVFITFSRVMTKKVLWCLNFMSQDMSSQSYGLMSQIFRIITYRPKTTKWCLDDLVSSLDIL